MTKAGSVFLAAALLSLAQAQQPPSQPGVYRIGGDVKAPTLISKHEPEYSEEARKAKLEGTVVLSLVVGEDGTPRDIRVVKPVGLGLDENAISAVTGWRFSPGTKAEVPVPVNCSVEVSFRLLLDPREWHVAGLTFVTPPGASQPLLL